MKFLGNLIWILTGGFIIFLEYLVFSIILMVSIIGIPFGLQTLKLASLALWPFGRKTVVKERSAGCLHILFNIFWIVEGGIWIALSHFLFGIILCVTIIGIPFGKQHFKLAETALNPFGRDIIYC